MEQDGLSIKRVKIAPSGRWDAQKARALYP